MVRTLGPFPVADVIESDKVHTERFAAHQQGEFGTSAFVFRPNNQEIELWNG
jgi:hypothetical protein